MRDWNERELERIARADDGEDHQVLEGRNLGASSAVVSR
jgi:hypothetical protein